MPKFRGLTTRFCPTCGSAEAHRTFYARTESGYKTTWLRIFWVCTKCNTLNHVIIPTFRLQSEIFGLPSTIAVAVTKALKEKPLDFDDLLKCLRDHHSNDLRVITSEVFWALEYLKARGAVKEEKVDLTERTLATLRARLAWSSHLSPCPAEAERGIVSRGLVSLYAQYRLQVGSWGERARTGQLRLVNVGVFCIRCGYHHVEPLQMKMP
jgi:hypothetical protein